MIETIVTGYHIKCTHEYILKVDFKNYKYKRITFFTDEYFNFERVYIERDNNVNTLLNSLPPELINLFREAKYEFLAKETI